jgi:NAD(P)-dependent dehydrogenase (short-subunit alcohol dehydrogenase family)
MTPPTIRPPAAVVTGAASGIGLATATELARRGYRVAMLDRDGAALRTRAALLAEEGHNVHDYQVDVTILDDVTEAVNDASDRWDGLDAAAACAGIEVLGDVLTVAPAEWQRAFQVNLNGVFNLARSALPHLIPQRGGFVAVASDAGITGAQGYSAYAASKHAVVGLIRCMALDYGPAGVRSNVVCPAFVQTPMADRIFADTPEGEIDFYRSTVPLGRFAEPAEVAAAIAHLIGPEASYTNGLVYNIDGGSTAGYFRGATV